MQSPDINLNSSSAVGPGPTPGGRFNWKRLWLWSTGAIIFILIILWFSRTSGGLAGLGEGAAQAYYGSFKQLGVAKEIVLDKTVSVGNYPRMITTMSDGKLLFYEDDYDTDWAKDFSIFDPKGDLANDCITPKLYTFDPTTNQFAYGYDKVKITNPLQAQVKLLPNGKLFVLGYSVPVGFCWAGLPAEAWQYAIDFSGTTIQAITYDLYTGEASEAKVVNPAIEGMDRMVGRMFANSQTGGVTGDTPVVVELPGKGLLISGEQYQSREHETRTYIYDYKKNNLTFYKEPTGLPTQPIDSSVLLLKDGRSLIYDNAARSIKIFNSKTLQVEQFHQARLGSLSTTHFWQLDDVWVLAWESSSNEGISMSGDWPKNISGNNPSDLYLYNLKTNQLYQRKVEDWPLKQYADQGAKEPGDKTLPAELPAYQKRFVLWPVSPGVLLVAAKSYQNLPWSFGLFSIDTLKQLPAVNADEVAKLRPEDHFIGNTVTRQEVDSGKVIEKTIEAVNSEHNISFVVDAGLDRLLFFNGGSGNTRQYVTYTANDRSTGYQLRHKVSDLSGWEELTYEKK